MRHGALFALVATTGRYRCPMILRRLAPIAALAALCAVPVACGDDDGGPSEPPPPEAATEEEPRPTDAAQPDADADQGSFELSTMEFRLTTADDSITVQGTAGECAGPGDTSLETEFSDGTNTVRVAVADGSGTVTVPGIFEGTVEDISIGESGIVSMFGRGSLADDSAQPTTFEVVGICP